MEYTNSHMEHCINEYIHSSRNRTILKRKLIDNITYEKLAEEVNLSVRQVKTIVNSGKAALKPHI